jgi:hypothetical protein
MKKPSVPWRAGVRRSVASLPSAEVGGSPPTPARHESRHGNVSNPEWFARNEAIWSPFYCGSTEQVA